MGTNEFVDIHGVPNNKAIKLMLSLILSDTLLGADPDIILGRIWPKSKVVSFWNRSAEVHRNRTRVLEFVRVMKGKERKFRYEVEGEMLDYDAFQAGGSEPSPSFDPSKVHTMLPGPGKAQMMGAMGFMRSKPVDARDRLAREGD